MGWSSSPVARVVGAAAVAIGALSAMFGCSPEWRVLEPDVGTGGTGVAPGGGGAGAGGSATGGGGVGGTGAAMPGGSGASAGSLAGCGANGCVQPPQPCTFDEECPPGQLCEAMTCVDCGLLAWCPACPAGWQPVTGLRRDCAVCVCEPSPACRVAEECEIGQLCLDQTCLPCDAADNGCQEPCPPDWSLQANVINGCEVCSCEPPSACRSDAECGADAACYAGLDCTPGFEGLAEYCGGNFCGLKGCLDPRMIDPTGLFCSLVGCPAGLRCEAPCGVRATCICDAATGEWSCSPGCDICVSP